MTFVIEYKRRRLDGMARKGRKRRDGPREANGQPQRESVADVVNVAKAQRMRFGATDGNWTDDKWENPLGRLRIFGYITDAEYRAGEEWRRQVSVARWLYDIPSPFPASANLLVSYGLRGERADVDPEARATALRRYNDTFGALRDAGHDATRAVNQLVIHERPIEPERLPLVKRGLAALAQHLGMDEKRRAAC